MRIANLAGRASLVSNSSALDVERASEREFGTDVQDLYCRWDDFSSWARGVEVESHPLVQQLNVELLLAPVPRPSQIFAIGLNYANHAAESGLQIPDNPMVFTKFPSSLTGPDETVRLSGERVDWEAELVVVIGSGGRHIPAVDGWGAIAGLMAGQDLSDRIVQSRGNPAQFSLGKSFERYAPTGPWVTTVDEVRARADIDALRITCTLIEDQTETSLQDGTTADLIFPVPLLVEKLSAVVQLMPGDLIFTGTPAGVGLGRDPQMFLQPGQSLRTTIEALGSIHQTFVA